MLSLPAATLKAGVPNRLRIRESKPCPQPDGEIESLVADAVINADGAPPCSGGTLYLDNGGTTKTGASPGVLVSGHRAVSSLT
jgi:hypothetical protein